MQRSYVVLALPVEMETETAGDGELTEAAEHNRGATDTAETAQRIAAYNDAALQVGVVNHSIAVSPCCSQRMGRNC